LPIEVDQKVREIEGVNDVHVVVTWDPPWDKSMMAAEARMALGLDDVIPLSRVRR
jgi:metal-sulfur cluster biosynthetic enzyme